MPSDSMSAEKLAPPQPEIGNVFQSIVKRGRNVVDNLRQVFQSHTEQRVNSASRAGGGLTRRKLLGAAAGLAATAAIGSLPPATSEAASEVPPPTGPRDALPASPVDGPLKESASPNLELQIGGILSSYEAQTRQPPVASLDKPPLSKEEADQLSQDIKDIASTIKAWMKPEFLEKHPRLDLTSIANDPEKLRAYKEAGYLLDDTLYRDDIRNIEDRVVGFMPEGGRGSMYFSIYRNPDGSIYKISLNIMTDGKGGLTTQFARPRPNIPADQLPVVAGSIFNIEGANLQWKMGEHADAELYQKNGEGQSGNLKISAHMANVGYAGITVVNLMGGEKTLTAEQIKAREQKRQEIQKAADQKAHDETRKPPIADKSKPELRPAEADRLTKDLAIAIEEAKKVFRPAVLAVNPALTDASPTLDPTKLKAYRDEGYIFEEYDRSDPSAKSYGDKIITFRPYGMQGGVKVVVYQSTKDWQVYSTFVYAKMTPSGELSSEHLQSPTMSKDQAGKVVSQVVLLPSEMQWGPGEHDSPDYPSIKGAGTVGNYQIRAEVSGSGAVFATYKPIPKTPFVGTPGLGEL